MAAALGSYKRLSMQSSPRNIQVLKNRRVRSQTKSTATLSLLFFDAGRLE